VITQLQLINSIIIIIIIIKYLLGQLIRKETYYFEIHIAREDSGTERVQLRHSKA
jgi:hypothetical protein